MKWKPIVLGFLIGIVFCVAFFLLFSIYLFGDIEAKIAKAGQNKVGEKFQVIRDSIVVTSLQASNQSETISPRTSDLLVLNFWATWCGPCKREMPEFQTVQRMTPGVKFYFLSDESLVKQREAIQRAGWSLPFYKTDSATMKRFSPVLPTTYVIKKGVIILKQEGELNWANPEIIDFLERLK